MSNANFALKIGQSDKVYEVRVCLRLLTEGQKAGSLLACEQALWGALATRREKQEEIATTSVEFKLRLQFPYDFPSTELSDFAQSARSGNEREYRKTLKKRESKRLE